MPSTTPLIATSGFHRLAALLAAAALAACQPTQTPPTAQTQADAGIAVREDERTPLDIYVAKPDAAYGWSEISNFKGDGYTAHVLEMTSQTWRSAADVDRPVWTHWMTVIRPDEIASDKALLYIGGGDNDDDAPTQANERSARIALATKSVVVDLGMVPNQPLYFTDSPDEARYEDDLIAYTRVKHFNTRDDEWLVRLAMVKSGVRAMDATQEFLASDAGGGHIINQFVVSGASKRGWTSWLVGAVDPRVIAVMPLVIDALNSEEITRHHYEVLGFFAPSLGDYVNHGLFPHKVGTPEYQAVLAIEDPYNYRDRGRMKIPKFIVNASGDQYFHPDNSRFYYGALPEEKHLRYVENTRHNLAGSDAVDSMLAFYQAVITGVERPRYSWTQGADGTLTVRAEDTPDSVTLWQAHNPETRDFRVEHLGEAYVGSPLERLPDGTWMAKVDPPETGFTAYFIEMSWDKGLAAPFKFSTAVSITPDTLPYRWEDAAEQYADTAQ